MTARVLIRRSGSETALLSRLHHARRLRGPSAHCYRDVAASGLSVRAHRWCAEGQTVTAAQAYQLLCGDLRSFENFVEARTDAMATSQNQFDAMVSLAYNIAPGASSAASVLRAHKDGDFVGAARDFLLWDKPT